jgi:glycosyltransferase involved in cell wall biosynthesis
MGLGVLRSEPWPSPDCGLACYTAILSEEGNTPSPVITWVVTQTVTGPSGISIVIPAWNEEDRLARTLERYLPALEARGEPFEVIVVADGVRDRTAEVAAQYASRHVRVLLFPNKLGKGGAILAGIKVSRFEYVGYLDADGPISPREMYGLVDYLTGDVDCVVASRWTRGASGAAAEPLFNRVAGRGWNVLTRSLLFLPLRDTQAGAKFFKGPVVRSLLRSVTLTNRAFDVDLLYHVRKEGKKVKEVPVRWQHDAATRMPIVKAIPVMFVSLIGVRLMNSPAAKRVPNKLVRWFLNDSSELVRI